MAGDNVIPTENDFKIARDGIAMQFAAWCPDVVRSEVKGLEEFLENQAQVLAHERAYNRKLQVCLHPK